MIETRCCPTFFLRRAMLVLQSDYCETYSCFIIYRNPPTNLVHYQYFEAVRKEK